MEYKTSYYNSSKNKIDFLNESSFEISQDRLDLSKNTFKELINTNLNRKNEDSSNSLFKINDETSNNNKNTNLIYKKTAFSNTLISSKNLKDNNCLFNVNRMEDLESERSIKKFNNVYDSFSEEEFLAVEININEKNESDRFLILYKGKTKEYLDMFMLFIIIYASIFSPLNLCFQNHDFNYYAEMGIEFIFIIDMILYFFTQITDHEENLINSKKLICFNYLNGWFLFDFVTSFPYNLIENIYIPDDSRSLYFWFFIIKWVKVTRVLRLSKYEFLLDKKVSNSKKKRIMKLIIIFLISIHVSSCFWIFIGKNSPINNNWMTKDLLEKNDVEIYIASFYFHLVTVYTVGYGDILCTNQIEMLYNCYLLLVGVLLYSFAVTAFSKLFADENPRKIEYFNKMDALDTMKRDYNLTNILYSAIKRSIIIEYEKNYTDRYELLNNLPSAVKHKLTDYLYDFLIKDLAFFSEKNYGFILFVMPFLKRHKLQRGQTLCEINETLDEMYIVINGCLSLTLGSQYSNLEVGVIKQNYHFGDVLIQTNQKSPFEIISKSKVTEVFVLKKSDFFKIKQEFHSIVFNILQNSLKRLENYNKRKIQYLQLFNFEKSVSRIRNIIKKFNVYLMERGFNDFFYKGKDFEEMNDFITNNDFDIMKKFLLLLDQKHKRRSTNFNVLKGLKHVKSTESENKKEEYISPDANFLKESTVKENVPIKKKKSVLKNNNEIIVSTINTPPKFDKSSKTSNSEKSFSEIKLKENKKDQAEPNEFLTFGNIQPDSSAVNKTSRKLTNKLNKTIKLKNISETKEDPINLFLKNLEKENRNNNDFSKEQTIKEEEKEIKEPPLEIKIKDDSGENEGNVRNEVNDLYDRIDRKDIKEIKERKNKIIKKVKKVKFSGKRMRNSILHEIDDDQRLLKKFRLKIFELIKCFLGKSGSSDNEILKQESELNDKIIEVINCDSVMNNTNKKTNFSTNYKVMKIAENTKNPVKEKKPLSVSNEIEPLRIENVENFNFMAKKKFLSVESTISLTIPHKNSISKAESCRSLSSNKNILNIRTKKNSEQAVKIMNSNYTFNIFMDQNIKDKNKEINNINNNNIDVNNITDNSFSNKSSERLIEINEGKKNEMFDYFQSHQKLKNIIRKIKNILK